MGLGFLEKTIAELPNWNKMLPGFPVIRWSSFMEYIRTRVNLLATEEHLKELAYQLQVVGEVGRQHCTALLSGKRCRCSWNIKISFSQSLLAKQSQVESGSRCGGIIHILTTWCFSCLCFFFKFISCTIKESGKNINNKSLVLYICTIRSKQ